MPNLYTIPSDRPSLTQFLKWQWLDKCQKNRLRTRQHQVGLYAHPKHNKHGQDMGMGVGGMEKGNMGMGKGVRGKGMGCMGKGVREQGVHGEWSEMGKGVRGIVVMIRLPCTIR